MQTTLEVSIAREAARLAFTCESVACHGSLETAVNKGMAPMSTVEQERAELLAAIRDELHHSQGIDRGTMRWEVRLEILGHLASASGMVTAKSQPTFIQ